MNPSHTTTRWRLRSIALIVMAWATLQLGGLFSPGLLDDVDSIYLQVAREMLQRHDFVTPTIDGIRFFDKPPLMYWLAAGSMRLFGTYDWAGRLPLALGVLALLLAVYALGNYLFAPATASPITTSDRPGLYAALILATSLGPYLYTRFFIPDILIALWLTLGIHLFLVALERVDADIRGDQPPAALNQSALLPCLGFAAVLALNLLTKGLIGLVFPCAFVVLYMAFTHRLGMLAHILSRLYLLPSAAVFVVIAAPWHILAALRNPAIAMPAGVGLPARAGWAWFYLYNEHVARFLGRRIPHDYGQTPVWLFWILALLWIMPWTAFLPAAIAATWRTLRGSQAVMAHPRRAAITLTLWTGIVLVFFTFSSRQEYYSLPAIPALALLVVGLLTRADTADAPAIDATLACHRWLLAPLASILAAVCVYFAITAPTAQPGVRLDALLTVNPELYNLSLGHVFDLTGTAMSFFRGPLTAVAAGMLILGPVAYFVRRGALTFAANLTVAGGMTLVLLGAHEGLVRFYPILGSRELALAIERQRQPGDQIVVDGELTAGSTLLFYTQNPAYPNVARFTNAEPPAHVLFVNGRVNGPWFGSFWPDAPRLFPDDTQLRQLWAGAQRVYLLTYDPAHRIPDLARFAPVRTLAAAGGKTILTNR